MLLDLVWTYLDYYETYLDLFETFDGYTYALEYLCFGFGLWTLGLNNTSNHTNKP